MIINENGHGNKPAAPAEPAEPAKPSPKKAGK